MTLFDALISIIHWIPMSADFMVSRSNPIPTSNPNPCTRRYGQPSILKEDKYDMIIILQLKKTYNNSIIVFVK